jgi:hypothetical protein
MKLKIEHNTTKAEAKKKVKGLLKGLAKRHSDVVSDVQETWDGDLLDFGFRARGMKAQGTMEVTEDEVVVEGRLPLLARPFESRIKSAIEKEARSLFRKA